MEQVKIQPLHVISQKQKYKIHFLISLLNKLTLNISNSALLSSARVKHIFNAGSQLHEPRQGSRIR